MCVYVCVCVNVCGRVCVCVGGGRENGQLTAASRSVPDTEQVCGL